MCPMTVHPANRSKITEGPVLRYLSYVKQGFFSLLEIVTDRLIPSSGQKSHYKWKMHAVLYVWRSRTYEAMPRTKSKFSLPMEGKSQYTIKLHHIQIKWRYVRDDNRVVSPWRLRWNFSVGGEEALEERRKEGRKEGWHACWTSMLSHKFILNRTRPLCLRSCCWAAVS
jgi:hypothetical protein